MKRLSKTLSAVLVLALAFTLSSCAVMDLGAMMNDGTSSDSHSDEYMTREEVEQLLQGVQENVTVNAGDSYNIEINSLNSGNVIAASRALLSSVSVDCTFNVTKVVSGGFMGGGTTTKTTQKYASGSGVIYKLDKNTGSAYVITNYHVVHLAGSDTANDISDQIKIYLYGQEYKDYAINAKYIGGSMNYDIAVLRVEGSEVLRESNAAAATFADSNGVAVLDTAIAIGNPTSGGISATVGAVNIESEEITMSALDGNGSIELRVMRTDAAVNGGNSGGGLFNGKGELIGIVNAKMSSDGVENIGYAIPSNVARYVADNIIYYDTLDTINDSVYRILVGISVSIGRAYTEYNTETGRVRRLEEVTISSVVSGGAAEGKLAEGDVINSVTIDGEKYDIVRTYNVVDVMLTARQGSTVVFNVTRNGQNIDVTVDVSRVSLTAY